MAWSSRRGGGHGRGRGGRYYASEPTGPTVDLKKIFEGLRTEPIKTWTVKTLAEFVQESDGQPLQITNRQILASYNFDKTGEHARIVVPGAPKEFREWGGGNLSGRFNEIREIPVDRGLDTLFAAVRIMQPGFKLKDYDIVGDLDSIKGLFHICLQVVNSIRAISGQGPVGTFKIGHDEIKLRIDVQMVGNSLLLLRQEQQLETAGGVGLQFRRMCSKPAPLKMMRGEQLDDGNSDALFKMVMGMDLGKVKILITDEIDAAEYPDEVVQSGELTVPQDIDLEVVIGGFKGTPDKLIPISMASRSIRDPTLHPGKWLKQYLNGTVHRYVGLHDKGLFRIAPVMKTLDDVQEMCRIDEAASDMWLKSLEQVLHQIVAFTRTDEFSHVDGGKFAIIVDPDQKLSIHVFESQGEGSCKLVAVSERMMEYLMTTVN